MGSFMNYLGRKLDDLRLKVYDRQLLGQRLQLVYHPYYNLGGPRSLHNLSPDRLLSTKIVYLQTRSYTFNQDRILSVRIVYFINPRVDELAKMTIFKILKIRKISSDLMI